MLPAMRTTPLLFVAAVTLFAACGDDGGSSGVPDSTKIGDLTSAQSIALCHESAAAFPERTVTCNGQTATVGLDDASCDTEDQTAPAGCQATVGQARACFDAFAAQTDAQFCTGTLPPACAPLSACQETGRTQPASPTWAVALTANLR